MIAFAICQIINQLSNIAMNNSKLVLLVYRVFLFKICIAISDIKLCYIYSRSVCHKKKWLCITVQKFWHIFLIKKCTKLATLLKTQCIAKIAAYFSLFENWIQIAVESIWTKQRVRESVLSVYTTPSLCDGQGKCYDTGLGDTSRCIRGSSKRIIFSSV